MDDPAGRQTRVVIAGGGTGGHLTPAVALGRELAARGASVVLVGAPRAADRALLPASGLPWEILPAPSLERRRWWRNAALPWTLPAAVVRGRRLIAEHRPDVAVGTGGYVMLPVVMAARVAGVPVLLQEQNRVPGVATRLAARWARRICVQFEDGATGLGGRADVEVTGTPIAPPVAEPADFAERLAGDRPVVGVFGGSQGARAINDAVTQVLRMDPSAAPFQLVWQTGSADHDWVSSVVAWPERFVIRPFFTPMAAVYPLLDLVVCRAGATTLAEVTAWGLPSILIPYAHATGGHQAHNARAMERAGAAVVVEEADLGAGRLGRAMGELLADPERRRVMADAARSLGRPDAAARVADRVLALAREAA